MPNRILKDTICTSDTLDKLTPEAEVFFYRLLVQCDDYGRFDARPMILLTRCYPLKIHRITEKDVTRWLQELVAVGTVQVYEVEGKAYLQVVNWSRHQQTRAKASKYPPMLADASNCLHPLESAPEYEYEYEYDNKRSESKDSQAPLLPAAEKPDPLTTGQRYMLTAFGAKRYRTEIQKLTVGKLEAQYGIETLTQAIDWTAKRGMALGQAVTAIEGALPKWNSNGHGGESSSNGKGVKQYAGSEK
jgi:hypothetical protein